MFKKLNARFNEVETETKKLLDEQKALQEKLSKVNRKLDEIENKIHQKTVKGLHV